MTQFYAGIDIGSTHAKVVIINESHDIVYHGLSKNKGNPIETIQYLIKKGRKKNHIRKRHLSVSKTGHFAKNINTDHDYLSEMKCLAAGARLICPDVRTIIDIGSFTNKVILLDESGKIFDYQRNDICSSGSGIFLELISKSLDVNIEQLPDLVRSSENPEHITSQCSIFAESEVIYLMNEGRKIADIAKGCCQSIVGRIVPLVQRLNPIEPMIMTGGVSKNMAVYQLLEQSLGLIFQQYSFDPQFVVAYGCAFLSKERREG